MSDDTEDAIRLEAQQRVGQVLNDKWTLDALVGVGGMAAVYAATHRNQSRVAIKILHAQLSMNRVFRERFLREGYAANSVGHAGVVRVHDDDITKEGSAFLVMELLEGEGLYDRWVRKGQRLPVHEVLGITHSMLDVLKAAHSRDIIHRDLKPENLFLTREGTLKILDFGIARLRGIGTGGSATMAGSPMGTPSFMPPEQALGHWDKVDATSDLWAVGATMFTLLTGKYVHDASTMSESLVMAATRQAPSLASVAPETPAPVVALVDRALAFDKAARWPDAQAMQENLLRVHAQLTGSAAPELPASRVGGAAPQEGQSAPSGAAPLKAASSSPDAQKGTLLGTGPASSAIATPAITDPAVRDTLQASAQPPMQATTTTRAIELGILTDSKKRQRRWIVGGSLGAAAAVAGLYFLLAPGSTPTAQPDVSATAQESAPVSTAQSDPMPVAEPSAIPESLVKPAATDEATEPSVKADTSPVDLAEEEQPKPAKSPPKASPVQRPIAPKPAAPKPPPRKQAAPDPAPAKPAKPRDPFSSRQ